MIGEIRDSETAEVAIQSALTGHMVFSTVHTNDAPGAIVRLQEMEVEPFLLSSAIIGVLAQRLVRVICEYCKIPEEISPETMRKLEIVPDSASLAHLWKGEGCEKCNHTGYKGRSGIFELLVVNEEIKKLINSRASSGVIKAKAREMGMKTLREDGWDKIVKGVTSTEEVLRVTVEEHH
ncbi:MAG: GspE/PulE family protein [Nitrospinota bacterium]